MAPLLSASFWAFLVVTSVALFPVALVIRALTAPFDRRRIMLHQFTCFWASLYTWFNPAWSLRIEGRHKMRRGQAYVMVSNHLSLVDIFVLFRLFRHFKWVSKIENFRLPFIGWNMYLNGYIALRRGDKESVLKMLQACRETLAAGSSIMMFPEGTRSETGVMRPFKPGAFELALTTGKPILPIVIDGTEHALPKHGWVLRGRHSIHVRVLDELAPASFAGMTAAELADHVRALIAEHRRLQPSATENRAAE